MKLDFESSVTEIQRIGDNKLPSLSEKRPLAYTLDFTRSIPPGKDLISTVEVQLGVPGDFPEVHTFVLPCIRVRYGKNVCWIHMSRVDTVFGKAFGWYDQTDPGIYRAVIDDVMANIKHEFDEYGVAEDVLAELQHKWENKVIASHVAEFETPAPAQAAQHPPPHPMAYQHPLMMHPAHYSNPYALPQQQPGGAMNPVKAEPLDNRYMLHANMSYLPPLPGPVLNGARPIPGQPPQHPGGQTGVISFPRPLQPQAQGSRPAYNVPAAPQAQPPAQGSQPAQRIPQVDGPSESSGDEDDSPPPSQGQVFAPRTSHPSLPQPRATTSAVPAPALDSEAINSDLDDSDTEGEEEAEEGAAGETDIVFCTYDKVARVKNKWKCILKDGMIHVNGKDYLFAKCTGRFLTSRFVSEFEW
ncbi:hypothetical protein DXG01_004924 [Tephrocybe rancida]|nr:hypothetical protein DXG01_004924 [Tephrocybe rancida]